MTVSERSQKQWTSPPSCGPTSALTTLIRESLVYLRGGSFAHCAVGARYLAMTGTFKVVRGSEEPARWMKANLFPFRISCGRSHRHLRRHFEQRFQPKHRIHRSRVSLRLSTPSILTLKEPFFRHDLFQTTVDLAIGYLLPSVFHSPFFIKANTHHSSHIC